MSFLRSVTTPHAKKSTGTLILKLGSTGIGFVITLVLARWLGAHDYGIYAFSFAWIRLLGISANLGFPQLMVRNIAVYVSKRKWSLYKGLWRFSNISVLLFSLFLGVISLIFSYLLIDKMDLRKTFWISLALLPLFSLNQIRQATMRGMNYIIQSQIPDSIIRPILFLFVLSFLFIMSHYSITAYSAMAIHVGAATFSLIIGYFWLRFITPANIVNVIPNYERRIWLKAAIPLLVVNGLFTLNAQADTVMLGALKSENLVGIYSVVKKLVDMVRLLLISVNMAIAPSIASLWANGERKKLQKILTRGARVVVLGTIPVTFILVQWGSHILNVFGVEYVQGNMALIILCVGQLINAFMGSVGLLLIMTGHERVVAIGVGIAAGINILLNLILIPHFGLEGAAMATGISMVIWNILLLKRVHQLLKLKPTALGSL